MPIPARYPGSCRGCPNPITPGQSVERTRHGWAHTQCLALALRKENPGAVQKDPAYKVACPTCSVRAGDRCVSVNGKVRAVHPARTQIEGMPESGMQLESLVTDGLLSMIREVGR